MVAVRATLHFGSIHGCHITFELMHEKHYIVTVGGKIILTASHCTEFEAVHHTSLALFLTKVRIFTVGFNPVCKVSVVNVLLWIKRWSGHWGLRVQCLEEGQCRWKEEKFFAQISKAITHTLSYPV